MSKHQPLISDEELLSILDCVAESGNQTMCDEFIYCDKMLPLPYNIAYDICVPIYNPDGIGKCTENEELYHSADDREKINTCIESMVNPEELDAILTNIGDEKAYKGAELNAHIAVSGYKNEDQRKMQVEDFLLGNQLFLFNEANSPPTFEHRGAKGWQSSRVQN
ncbi:hypothetical protein AVEN_145983-1 [Araneus ventricosus]|uniref:Uncharacterized protein n=1 Tax=Araneus ventricosus TaxID=182803 RepID=A0A4Y2HB35_ARAVE|nr:hypothetical protein AVEN_145983-1 [Araneus ventricosus]